MPASQSSGHELTEKGFVDDVLAMRSTIRGWRHSKGQPTIVGGALHSGGGQPRRMRRRGDMRGLVLAL